MRKQIATVGGALCLLTVILFAVKYGAASSQKTAEPTTDRTDSQQVLIQEVKSLRRAFQAFADTNTQLQVAIERSRMQQHVVDRVNDELSSVRAESESYRAAKSQLEENLKNVEAALSTETDPQRRETIERERTALTSSIELNKTRIDDARERQEQLAATLQVERGTLSRINELLDSMVRAAHDQQVESK